MDQTHTYLELVDESQRTAALDLKLRPTQFGCDVIEIERVSGNVAIPSATCELRHFSATDSAEAEQLANQTRGLSSSNRWKIMDTGGGLRRWQIDCYFGEDEPLGPGRLQGRPRATTFEYAYANARIVD